MRALIAAAAVALLVLPAACDRALGVVPLADAGFVVVDAGSSGGADTAEIAPGCSLLRPQVCDREGSVCCEALERCVPAADGENVCVDAGDVAEGEACGGAGIDDCAAGLLCAAETADGAPVCRQLCDRVVALCPEGSSCVWDVEVAGQAVGLCATP